MKLNTLWGALVALLFLCLQLPAFSHNSICRDALDVIGKYESDPVGSYDAINQIGIKGGYGVLGYSGHFSGLYPGERLTDKTVGEIMALQYDDRTLTNQQWLDQRRLHTVGRYQFIGRTLASLVRRHNISLNAKFTPELQDKLALILLDEAGLGSWIGPYAYANHYERQTVQQCRAILK